MKGLILAGGTATRLFPLTIVTNKHLLPIYDRPMIYYPLETLAGMGIREVMVIVGGKSVGDIVELLGDGEHFGLSLTYRYQRGALGHRPRHRAGPGLRRRRLVLRGPRATTSCAGRPSSRSRRLRGGPVGRAARCSTRCPIRSASASPSSTRTGESSASRRSRRHPKSDLIPIGVYFLRPDAFDVIDTLAPSGRGEFEITDVLNHYVAGRRPLRAALRGPLDGRGHRAVPASGGRARRGLARPRAAWHRRPERPSA